MTPRTTDAQFQRCFLGAQPARERGQSAAFRALAKGAATLALFVVFLATLVPAADAATTWTVTSTGDGPGAECPSTTNCTLRAAAEDAHSGDTVVLGTGTYELEHGELFLDGRDITIKGA